MLFTAYEQVRWRKGTLRVAFSPACGYARVDPEVTVVETAGRALSGFAKVETVESVCRDAGEIRSTEFMAGCSGRFADDVDRIPDRIDPALLGVVQVFRRKSLGDYLRVVRRRRFVVRDDLLEFFSHHDVVMSPDVCSGGVAHRRHRTPGAGRRDGVGVIHLPIESERATCVHPAIRLHERRAAQRPSDRRAPARRGDARGRGAALSCSKLCPPLSSPSGKGRRDY